MPPARAAEGEGALPPAGGGRRHTQMQWFCFRAAQELHIGDICALHLSQSCDAELAIQVQDDHCLCRAVVESSNWLHAAGKNGEAKPGSLHARQPFKSGCKATASTQWLSALHCEGVYRHLAISAIWAVEARSVSCDTCSQGRLAL